MVVSFCTLDWPARANRHVEMSGLLLAVGLLVAPVGSGEATAQSGPTVAIESQEATAGDPVDVPVEINGFGEIGAISLTITYDPAVLSFPEETSTGGLISGAPRDDFTANVVEPGEIRISWFDARSPLPGEDGILLRLTFSTYEGGESAVAFDTESEIADPQASSYGASYQDGEVESATTQIDVSVRREFGNPAAPSDYELVALPGQPGVPLDETVTGERGTGWRGFGEGGASGDGEDANLQECVPGAQCTFQSGNGFWVISQSDWSFQGTVPGVPAESDLPSIPLQDGWNIVSNPLQQDLSWASVQSENGLNETLWRWTDEGEWAEASTLSSSVGGEAYYLFNGAGLDSLEIPTVGVGAAGMSSPLPVSQAPGEGLREARSGPRPDFRTRSRGNPEASRADGGLSSDGHVPKDSSHPGTSTNQLLRIHAEADGKRVAAVTVGLNSSLDEPHTYRAPPGYFAGTTFYIAGENGSPKFARRVLPADSRPRSFSLLLRGDPGSDVQLVATGHADGWESHQPVLVERKTGQTHELKSDPSVRISLPEDEGEAPLLLRLVEN